MNTKLSDLLGVAPAGLEKNGVFNALVNRDSLVYIDPHALLTAQIPELQQANLRYRRYASGMIRLLQVSAKTDDVFYSEVLGEFQANADPCFHFSHAISRGVMGMKHEMAVAIAATARKFVKAGITEPEIFTIISVLEGIEMKRSGYMAAQIVLPNLFAFTDRVVKSLNIEGGLYRYMGKEYMVPFHPLDSKPIILMPAEFLSLSPVAYNWGENDQISAENDVVKMMVQPQLGNNWKEAFDNCYPSVIKKVLFLHPSLMVDMIRVYRNKQSNAISAEMTV